MSRKRQLEDRSANEVPHSKHKKQFTEHDKKLASIYDELADDKQGTRIRAAKNLLLEFSAEQNPEFEGFDIVLRRLIKGLCSSRKSARAGFFIALSELLRQCSTSEKAMEKIGSAKNLLLQIDNLTKADANFKQEIRGNMLGRATAYKAVLQSSLLTEGKSSNPDDWAFFLSQICLQAHTIPWLREECGSMLCEYIVASSKISPSHDQFVQRIVDEFISNDLMKTPEGVAVWINAQSEYPDLKFPKGVWHKQDPLHSKERSSLGKILCESKESNNTEEKPKVKGGSWKPYPNFAWHVVLRKAFDKVSKVSKFRQFWIEVVDNALFADKASSERKFWGFNLVGWAMSSAPQSLLPELLSPNFMRCLINQRFEQGRELFKAANHTLEQIVARGEKDFGSASILFDALVSSETSVQFDRITKSKTIERLASSATDSPQPRIIRMMSALIENTPSSEPSEAAKDRSVLAGLLVSMCARCSRQQTVSDDHWAKELVNDLASFAYINHDDAVPPISDDTRSLFHERLIQSINNLFSRLDSPGLWLSTVVHEIAEKVRGTSPSSLSLQADDGILKTVDNSHVALRHMRKSNTGTEANRTISHERPLVGVLQLLFSLILLEVYGGDADAVEMLTELLACYSSMDLQHTESKDFDQLVELLLSFISRSSSFYRQISERIFPVLASGISEDGLDSLLDILSKREGLAGQEELFEPVDANGIDESGNEDSEDGSMDSDVEMLSASGDEAAEVNGASPIEDESDEADESDDEELTQFNDLLAQTLKTSAPNEDDSSTSDESDMDDEQMMALDPHLTKIFQERRKAGGMGDGSKKKTQVKAKLQMTLFKSRVLDLLQIYVKKQYSDEMALKVMIPLLELMRTTTSAELESKARATLQSWWDNCDRNKAYPVPGNTDALWTALREIHEEVQREGSKQHDVTCSRGSLFIVKILMATNPTNIQRLVAEYATTQTQWIENGTNVQLSFFTEWCGWCAEWRKSKGTKTAPEQKNGEKPIGKKKRK